MEGSNTSYPCLTRDSAHAFHPLQPTDELEILSSPQAAGKLISPEESPRALEGGGSPSTSPYAPQLSDVNCLSCNGAGEIVVRPLAHYRQVCRPVEGDARELCQVELMNLTEDLLPHGHIRCRLFLFVQAVQRRVAIPTRCATSC